MVEKLKSENRRLLEGKTDSSNGINKKALKIKYSNYITKGGNIKQANEFLMKHGLRTASNKSLKNSQHDLKSSLGHSENLNTLKSMKSLKERLHSPSFNPNNSKS